MTVRSLALVLLACASVLSPALSAEPLELLSQKRHLNPESPDTRRVGDLIWRGGLEISSPDERLGGISGLDVSPDGRRLTAVTDRGDWVTAVLEYGADGTLTGIAEGRIGALRGKNGKKLKGKKRSDAEALAALPGGSLLVAFEHKHRIWRYPTGPSPLAQRPESLAKPPGLKETPKNHGMEALTVLADGAVLAIGQDKRDDGDFTAYLLRDGAWSTLRYRGGPGAFKPTGAALLPSGDVIVLERRFTTLGGIAIRVVRVEADWIVPNKLMIGHQLAMLRPPLTVDNMEGIAARGGPDGETLIYLISDNNFHPLQRTLLLMFALRG